MVRAANPDVVRRTANPSCLEIDIIEELQLRRWAREHYVAPNRRTAAQHPVVSDEMRLRDAEIIIDSRARDSVVAFVPLAPTVIQRLHEPHEQPGQPALLRQAESIDAAADAPQWIC
jgi:hypothetical protein